MGSTILGAILVQVVWLPILDKIGLHHTIHLDFDPYPLVEARQVHSNSRNDLSRPSAELINEILFIIFQIKIIQMSENRDEQHNKLFVTVHFIAREFK